MSFALVKSSDSRQALHFTKLLKENWKEKLKPETLENYFYAFGELSANQSNFQK